jgi:hypothetical protein
VASQKLKCDVADVIIFGKSIGSFPAVSMASRPYYSRLRGLVLVASAARCVLQPKYVPKFLLKEHRLHITKLARKSGEVDERLEEIASDIETLRRQLSSSTTFSSTTSSSTASSKATLAQKDLQQQIDKLTQDSAKFDQGLRSHTRILEAQSSLSATSSKATLAQKDLLHLQYQIDKLNRDSGKFDQGLRSHTRVLEAQKTTKSATQDHVSRLSQSVQKSLLDTHAQLQDVQRRHLDSAAKTVDILQFAAPRRKGGQ